MISHCCFNIDIQTLSYMSLVFHMGMKDSCGQKVSKQEVYPFCSLRFISQEMRELWILALIFILILFMCCIP